jgi:hypothetical protein
VSGIMSAFAEIVFSYANVDMLSLPLSSNCVLIPGSEVIVYLCTRHISSDVHSTETVFSVYSYQVKLLSEM